MTNWVGGVIGVAIGVAVFVIYQVIAEVRFRREGQMLADVFGRWADNPTQENAELLDLARKVARHER